MVRNHGQVVKMVGDEVLFVTDQPAEIALRLTGPDRDRKGLAPCCAPAWLRAGYRPDSAMCTGLWSTWPRLTSLARPGTAPVGAELAAALRRKADTCCSTCGPWPCPDTTTCRVGIALAGVAAQAFARPTHSAVIGTKSTAPGGYVGSA